MNWKQEAIERLRSYPAAETAMKNLSSEIRRVETMMESPGGVRLDGPVHSARTRQDWLLDNLVNLQLLKERLRQTQDWKRATDRAMDTLEPEEQDIIRQVYMAGRTDMERVSQENNSARATAYRLKNRALEKFVLALYGPAC